MKQTISKSIQTACASLTLMLALPSLAQETTVEETAVTSDGTVSGVDSDLITITTSASPDPIRFTYSKGTKYVDELGIPVSVTSVKLGVPVTVHYAAVGDSMVANKIVVKRTSKIPNAISDTTLVTAMGTISEFGPERMVVSTDSSSEPYSYSLSKKTTFVDETGAVVSTESVQSGIPVTVLYTKAGGKFIASKVIVRKAVATPGGVPATTKTTTTTSTGTVSDFGSDRIVVRTESSPEPLSYAFTKTTTYVDETGAPVSVETVKSGLPVTIHYSKVGDSMVANKVIVRKRTTSTPAGTAETTTTTTMGTISEFAPEALVIRTESAEQPIRYKFTKTTTYVDELGNPVSIKTVKSGLPVTVHYTKAGGSLVATKVIVRKSTTVPSDVPENTIESTTETRTETKTTTTMGTVNEFGPERMIIRTESSPDPVTYSFTKTTAYVDEAGEPVSIKSVKSGLPVTIHYTMDGDSRVATKIIVRKRTTTVVPR